MAASADSRGAERRYILMALAPMIVGIIVFTMLSFVGVAENKSPVASFTYSPSSPTTADTVQFTDNSSDEDGQVVSWSWNFGDGATSIAQNPSHQYTTLGTYTVTLTVTDDQGETNENSLVVNVSGVPSRVMFQDFEEGNDTPGVYFEDIWQANAEFETSIIHEGTRSLKVVVLDNIAGTVRINAASLIGHFDLSNATTFSVWVYDTQGNNTVELRLKDSEGNGGSGQDGNTLWSLMSAEQNQWTKITWDLSIYPSVPGLDNDRIASIELYEFNPGTYYFDNASFTRLG